MGLREKVALLIMALSFVEITNVHCVSNENKLKTSLQMSYKPKRLKWTKTRNVEKPRTTDESLKKGFHFPEVDYPLPPTFISTSYYNPKLDFTSNQLTKQPGNSMKNFAQQSIQKKNRKYNAADIKTPKKSLFVTFPEVKTTQMPYCLNGDDLFPSVDYPLEASDLWKTHYWDRILNIQPEVIQNIKEIEQNSKAKMKLSNKRATKYDLLSNILNSEMDADITMNHQENNKPLFPIDNKNNMSRKQFLRPTKKHAKNAEFVSGTRDRFDFTKNNGNGKQSESNVKENCESTNNLIALLPSPSSNLSSSDENCMTDELYSIAQVTPLPMDPTRSCYNEFTTPIPNSISPLTTGAPILSERNDDLCYKELSNFPKIYSSAEDSNSAEAEEEGLGDAMADEIGCTAMFPDIFSSAATTTMVPVDLNNLDSVWMYPELDNHTLNTYSDEVEEYYILVS